MSPVALSILALVVAMVSIQSGASVAKQLFPLVGAPGAAALRLFFAAIMLGCVWRPWRGGLTRRELRHVASYGAALGGMNFLFYLALARIPLGVAVALEFTGPLALAFWTSRRPMDFVWATLAVAGILMILPLSTATASNDLLGILLAVAAGACWVLYILFGQKTGSALHGGRASALGMAVAAAVVVPIGVAQAGAALFDWRVIPLAVGVAFFSSALPYSLEMVALKRLPTQTFGILMSLEPAIAALSGLAILHEQLTPRQWMAIAAVILASAGTSLSAKAQLASAEPPLQ